LNLKPEKEEEMNGHKIRGVGGLVWVLVLLTVTACGASPAEPTQTLAPSEAPKPSDTPVPSPTVIPTATLEPGQVYARVLEVIDGTTIVVEIDGEQETVCYDLTHMHDSQQYDRVLSEAETVNRALVDGQMVILDKREKGRTEDRDCLFRFVFLEDGTFVNAELLRLGLATCTGLSSYKYVDVLEAAEQEAMANGLGTWGVATSTPLSWPSQEYERFTLGDFRIADLSSMTAADEYIQIECDPIFPKPAGIYDLGGWRIVAEGTGKVFVFPEFVELFGGSTCRVYTGEPASECGGRKLSFKSSSEIWRNEHDCAYLYNPEGELEAKYCY
jgi:micrococcal nuclease